MNESKVEIKVTHIGGKWYIRCWKDNVIHSEDVAETRLEIGPKCRDLLRWVDKMGFISQYAEKSRHRLGRKMYERR